MLCGVAITALTTGALTTASAVITGSPFWLDRAQSNQTMGLLSCFFVTVIVVVISPGCCTAGGTAGSGCCAPTLSVTDAAAACIHPVPDISKLRKQSLSEGLRPLRLAGAMKVAEGQTTVEEVLRATPAWDV